MATTQNYEDNNWQAPETKIINGLPVRFCDVCVYKVFDDHGDLNTMISNLTQRWQCSEQGNWIMEHAVCRPYWLKESINDRFQSSHSLMARLSEQNQIFWQLKWK